MWNKKPKKTYSVLAKLLYAGIFFSIGTEAVLVISKAGGLGNIFKDKSTVIIVVLVTFIATVLFIIFGSRLEKIENSIDNSGSGRMMKWLQLFGFWPELNIDKKGKDKTFKKFLNYYRFVWWIFILIPLIMIIYFFFLFSKF